MRSFQLLISALFLSSAIHAATTIKSKSVEYAGKSLEFYTYSDPITKKTVFVFTLDFDKDGNCTKTVDTKSILFVFSDFGIYHGMLFLEPNQNIDLKFPPVREKTFADEKNPYFEPVPFWFTTENKNQLSSRISDFTIKLNQLTNKYFDQLYFRQSKKIYDSIVYQLNNEYSEIKVKEFIFHKKFALKMIESEAFREKPEDYSELFAGINPEFWLFPSFIELFEKTFNNQLSFEAKSIKGEELRQALNKSNLKFLQEFVQTKYKIAGDNAHLVLLKLLHDAWYSNEFSKSAIEKMVKSDVFSKSKNEIIHHAASNIFEKFTFLQPGNVAPTICLKELTGKSTCTNQDKEKFKYFVFADIEMIVCREHLKYLSKIQEHFQKFLEIYIILRKTEETEMKKFFTENEVPGIKLIDENNEFIEKYKVKSFPQCFLLDENHKVKFASAKAPLDGFEQQFATFIQHELFERQRNQSR